MAEVSFKFTGDARQLNATMTKLSANMERLAAQQNASRLGFFKLTGSIISAQVAMRAARAVWHATVGTMADAVKASASFNDAFTKSTAIMGDLSDAMKSKMIAAAQDVARTTTFSAREAAEAYYYLASAGLDAAQSVEAMPVVAKFAQAGAFNLAQATDLLTDAQSALGLTIRDDVVKNMENMKRVSDVLVKANTLANASVEQFSQALTTKAGTAMKNLGIEIESGVAVLAAWADQGIKAQEAGTAFNIVTRDLTTKALQNAAAFKENEVAVFDATGEMRNMAHILQDLEKRLDGMSDAQKKATLLEMGFADKSVIFIQSLIGLSARIRDYEEAMRDAGGITEEVARKQMESFSSQVKLVKNNWEILLLTLGDFITQSKVVREILKWLIDVLIAVTDSIIKNREEWIKWVSSGIQAVAGGVQLLLTSFGMLTTGLGKTGEAMLWVEERMLGIARAAGTLLLATPYMTLGKGILFLVESQQKALDSRKAVVEGFTNMGEYALNAGEKVRLLRDDLKFVTDQELANVESSKKAAEGAKEFREALQGLRDELDNVEGPTKKVTDRLEEQRKIWAELPMAMLPWRKEFREGFLKAQEEAITISHRTSNAFAANAKALLDYVPWATTGADATRQFNEENEEGIPIYQKCGESIEELAAAFQLLGLNATTTLGAILIGVAKLAAAIPAIKDFSKSIWGDPKLTGMERFTQSLNAIAQGIGGVIQATSQGSAAVRAFGGALQGAAAGAQIAGAVGAAIGAAAGAIVGIFRGVFIPKWKKVAREAGRVFGKELSEGLSKELEQLRKQLGSLQNAFAARIGDIVQEVGVTGQNVRQVARHVHYLIGMVEQGGFAFQEALSQVNKAFPDLVRELKNLGMEGSVQIGRIISRMRELGKLTGEIKDFIEETARTIVEDLSRVIDYLAKQLGPGGPLADSIDAANASITVLAGAFAAAVQAAGNLAGAVALLPESFGELLARLREIVGEENEALNALTRYYNFAKENQEALNALAALGDGFKGLIELGIINKNNINEWAEVFKVQFDEILASTQDETMALAAMAPQIALLIEAYRAMGVQVPEWLEEIANKAREAGVSLVPPEGLPDILKDIRDILLEIADALGAASRNAREFRNNMPSGDEYTPGGRGMPRERAQSGLFKKLHQDTLILAHAGEFAAILPRSMVSGRRVVFASAAAGFLANGGGPGDYEPEPAPTPETTLLSRIAATASTAAPAPAPTAAPSKEEIVKEVKEAVAESLREVRPSVKTITVSPEINVDLPSMVQTREGVEAARDLLVPEVIRAVELNLRGSATRLRHVLKD